MSMVRSNGSAERPRVQSRIWSRDEHRRGLTKHSSRSNSALVSCSDRSPGIAALDARASRSIRSCRTVTPYRQCVGRRIGAAQDGADAGQQFARIERLGQIVVGAHLQADDTIDFVALAVSIRIGMWSLARSRLQIDSPSSPGSIRSSTQSGRSCCSTAFIALPLGFDSNPSCCRKSAAAAISVSFSIGRGWVRFMRACGYFALLQFAVLFLVPCSYVSGVSLVFGCCAR